MIKRFALVVSALVFALVAFAQPSNGRGRPHFVVSAHTNITVAPQGHIFTIRGFVSPARPGTHVVLLRKYARTHRWLKGQRGVIQSDGSFAIAESAETTRTRQYRVVMPKQAGLRKGMSRPFTISVGPSADFHANLSWAGAPDLDLHVAEPNGNNIYFGNSGPSYTGGFLDTDTNPGCASVASAPQENVTWPAGRAQLGQYRVWVHLYDGCSDPNERWHLVVRMHGSVLLDTTGVGNSQVWTFTMNR